MADDREHRVVYVSHPASGLARSNFPLVCHVAGSRIVRSLPFQIPDDVRLYEIKTSRGGYTRPRKDVQMPLAYASKRRGAPGRGDGGARRPAPQAPVWDGVREPPPTAHSSGRAPGAPGVGISRSTRLAVPPWLKKA